jgi:hypothetical protein
MSEVTNSSNNSFKKCTVCGSEVNSVIRFYIGEFGPMHEWCFKQEYENNKRIIVISECIKCPHRVYNFTHSICYLSNRVIDVNSDTCLPEWCELERYKK